jgi:hypothetical protein
VQPKLSSDRLVLRFAALALLVATAALVGAAGAAAKPGRGRPHPTPTLYRAGRRRTGRRHPADGHHRRSGHHHHRRHHKRRRPTATPKPGGVALVPVPSPAPILAGPIEPVAVAAVVGTSPGAPSVAGGNPGNSSEGKNSEDKGGSSEKGGTTKGEEGGSKGSEEESAPPPPPAPVDTVKPAIGGVLRQNETLKATSGTWEESPTGYAYQWQVCSAVGRDCTNVTGASGSSHKLAAGEVDHTIRVVVTATNSGGSTAADSAVSGKVAAATHKPPPGEETKPPTEETKSPGEETEPPKEETKPPPTEETEPPGEETTPPSHTPPPSPACTQTFSSVSTAASALDSAGTEAAICLDAGSYGHLSVSGAHAGNVTIEPVPGAAVHLEGVTVAAGASYITIHDFDVGGGVSLGAGDSHITVDHNDIDGEGSGGDGEGVETLSVNCSAPNAPTYSGCTSTVPDSYITINGNEIHGYGQGETEDAIHLNDWEHVTITANDIYALEEHGNHTDAMQSVFGGHHMLFERNYEHDNQAQGFFIKDGDVSDVTVNDNLFLRNNNEPSLYPGGEYNIQLFNTTELTITKNTVWDGQDDILRAEGAAEALTATVNHNVEQTLDVLDEGGPAYALSENYDVFAEEPWTFKMGAQSKVESSPDFVDAATEDYELASNPNDVGVDWQPSEYVYGPTGD